MHYLSTLKKSCLCILLVATTLTGCVSPESTFTTDIPELNPASLQPLPFTYQVDPKTFSITLDVNGTNLTASQAMDEKTIDDLQDAEKKLSWNYPNDEVAVSVESSKDFLTVSITSKSSQDASFSWPHVSAEAYYLPLGEGKRVPSNDDAWKGYLRGNQLSILEQFSMPFWSSTIGDYALVYIMDNPHRSEMIFAENEQLSFNISTEFPQISKIRTQRFRIYVTENNPVAVAKIYRNYVKENGNFLTLEQKAKEIPAIKSLYGAPFIYLWGNFILSNKDIQWKNFKQAIDTPLMTYLLSFSDTLENGADFKNALSEILVQDYIAIYQKNVICNYFSELLTKDDLWNSSIFEMKSSTSDDLLKKGIERLSESELIQLNKYALTTNLPDVFNDPSTWMDDNTVDLMSDLKSSGIEQAWIGLHDYEQAFAKPELVNTALDQNYLIASYDSYHSIHKPGAEQWETATFPDTTLYEEATVSGKDGEKISGFQNVGRKLNPILALPSVKERMGRIIDTNKLNFNSWFVDCDATGEVYDDYSPSHITTQEEDLAARMDRMSYIRDTYKMVVGSEGGNDFASTTIAYAHGIELKSFSWMDEDMKKNKDSEYYIGKYYNPAGGVAEHFSKRIPLKDNLTTLFINPQYDLPLFKLVYNDSLVTSYHWDWSTFKIKGETQTRMLREILYNVPPLYHLDATEWGKYKKDITAHTQVWSSFSKLAIEREMTNFEMLSENGLVQSTQYGEDIHVIANFSDDPFPYQQEEIPAKSVLIDAKGKVTVYTPTVDDSHK